MALPTVLQGPAYVSWGSKIYYTEGNVSLKYERRTWSPQSASYGALGPRYKNTIVRVSFTPCGNVVAASLGANYFPHHPSGVGTSIIAADDLIIAPKAGNKVTFTRAGISKMPSLRLSAQATAFSGDMEFIALGDSAMDPTNAAYWQVAAATAADTSFTEATILSPRYTAAWGATYTGMEPDESGFIFEPSCEVKEITSCNQGVLDVILASAGLRCRFRPITKTTAAGMTEADYAGLLLLQDATAALPGMTVGNATSLVVTGTGLVVTAPTMGPTDGALHYGVAEWRQGEVTFENKVAFAVGVPAAMWTFVAS